MARSPWCFIWPSLPDVASRMGPQRHRPSEAIVSIQDLARKPAEELPIRAVGHALFVFLAGQSLSVVGREHSLAQSDRLGRYFDQLVAADELDRRLKRQLAVWRQVQSFVVRVCPHVRLLLLFGRIDVHVVRTGILTDDHALVDVRARADEQRRALLHPEQRISVGGSGTICHHDARGSMRDLARPRTVALAYLVHEGRASGFSQELPPEADKATDWNDILHPNATIGIRGHLLQSGLPVRQGVLDRPYVIGRDVNRDALVGLVNVTVDLAQDDFGPADLEFVALTTHLLDEYGQLQLAAASDLVRVGRLGR